MSDLPSIDSKTAKPGIMPLLRLGDLLLDLGRQRVTRDGNVIALPKLSYDLLMALVRAAPNLVSADVLMEQVWPRAVVSPETRTTRTRLSAHSLD